MKQGETYPHLTVVAVNRTALRVTLPPNPKGEVLQRKVLQKLGRWHGLRFVAIAIAGILNALAKIGTLIDYARVTGRRPEQAPAQSAEG